MKPCRSSREPVGGPARVRWAILLGLWLVGFSAQAVEPVFRLTGDAPRDLSALLEPLRAKWKAPALGAAVIRAHSLAGLGVAGVRRQGVGERVTVDDRWHHGSLTKAMTASLVARMVEAGRVGFDTRLSDVFPEHRDGMDPAWREVTLEQLLGHRAGAPGGLEADGLWGRLWNNVGTPVESRMLLLTNLTARPPVREPGTGYGYSNAGYAIAGAMLERIEGRPWEVLMREWIFVPLGMESAGFGVPATPRYVDEPWGHALAAGQVRPIEPGTAADNPPAIGPGGTVHASLRDLATFVAWHLVGDRSPVGGLSGEGFRRLHQALPGQGYALGWNVAERDWAGGRVLHHTGSNTQWYTNVWLAPERGWAFVVVANFGGDDDAFRCTDAVVAALIAEFLPAD